VGAPCFPPASVVCETMAILSSYILNLQRTYPPLRVLLCYYLCAFEDKTKYWPGHHTIQKTIKLHFLASRQHPYYFLFVYKKHPRVAIIYTIANNSS